MKQKKSTKWFVSPEEIEDDFEGTSVRGEEKMKKGDRVRLIEDYKNGSKIFSEGLEGTVLLYYDLPEDYNGAEVDDAKVEFDSFKDQNYFKNRTEIVPVNKLEIIEEK